MEQLDREEDLMPRTLGNAIRCVRIANNGPIVHPLRWAMTLDFFGTRGIGARVGLHLLMLIALSIATMAFAATEMETEILTSQGYRIQPGDIVMVSVWQEPDLKQLILVRPDGGISFPLAGDLKAAGLMVDELTAAITQKLRQFIPDAVVTVTLQETPGNRIYVLGRVNKPGDFPIVARDISVMQALAIAGGLTPFADEKNIKILRMEQGKQRPIPFDYRKIRRGKSLEQNISLQAGDVIVVP